jgi:hypothetical protein
MSLIKSKGTESLPHPRVWGQPWSLLLDVLSSYHTFIRFGLLYLSAAAFRGLVSESLDDFPEFSRPLFCCMALSAIHVCRPSTISMFMRSEFNTSFQPPRGRAFITRPAADTSLVPQLHSSCCCGVGYSPKQLGTNHRLAGVRELSLERFGGQDRHSLILVFMLYSPA